jgi:plasmid stabilization system protein ParE
MVDLLANHLHAERAKNKGNLRRVVANPYPYVIFYRPDATEIVIHGVRHTARRPR